MTSMSIIKPYSLLNWVIISVLFLLLIGANTYLSLTTIKDLDRLQEKIREYDRNLMALQNAHVSLLTAESGQRGFLLTQNAAYLEYYNDAIVALKNQLQTAARIVSKQNQQQALLEMLMENVNAKILELETTIIQTQNNDLHSALELVETDQGRMLYNRIFTLFEQIKSTENKLRIEQIDYLNRVRTESERNNLVSFITSLLLVVGILVLARVNIKNHQRRQDDIEEQNQKLQLAVDDRTRELSIFSDELSRSNRELEDFAFVASHDLQEPLRKILAFGDRLLSHQDNFSEKQTDYLLRMTAAAKRMSTLISDLLEFSRVATRGKPFETVDLNLVIEHCLEDLEVLIDETNADIRLVDAPTVIADPTQMRQLFFNLIANAVKFSKKNRQPIVEIEIVPTLQPADVEIEGLSDWRRFRIKDNGIGFDPEYAEKIFAPFQRLHSRDSYKGTGIGLAICRRIVERHNGTIIAAGKPDEGAVFEVVLPAANKLIITH